MAIRKDEVQLDLTIVTDEARQMAKTIEDSRDLAKELRAAQKAGEDTTGVMKKIAAAGKSVEGIDLSKLTTAQMVTRARQLKQQMALIPQSSPAYKKLQGEMKGINDRLATTRAQSRGVAEGMDKAKSSFASFGNAIKGTVVLALAAAFAKLVEFGHELFTLGPELGLMDKKASQVFGDMEGYVTGFAENNAEQIGLSVRQYKDLAASVSDVLVPLGFERDLAAQIAVETTNAAGKLSEWTSGKVSTEEASEKLRKAYLGERDGLEALGVKVNEAAVTEKLRAEGLDKLTGNSLEQAKALITLQLITEKTADAQDSFATNSDQAARAQARTKAVLAELKEEIAEGAGPIIDKLSLIVLGLAKRFVSLAKRGIEWVKSLSSSQDGVSNFSRVIGVAIGVIVSGATNAITLLGGLGSAIVDLVNGNFLDAYNTTKETLVTMGKTTAENIKKGATEGLAGFNPLDGLDLSAPDFEEEKIDFTSAFDALRETGETKQTKATGKSAAQVEKEKLDLLLKERQAYFERLDLVERANIARGLVTEEEGAAARLQIEEDALRDKLSVLADHGKDQELEYQKTETAIAELLAKAAADRKAAQEARDEEKLEADAKSLDDQLQAIEDEANLKEQGLRLAFARQVITEQELEDERLRIKEEAIRRELALVQEAGETRKDEANELNEQLLEIEIERTRKSLENEQRTQELKAQLHDTNLKLSSDAISVGIELLSQDEEARKKNAAAIKAFEVAKIGTNLAAEISAIWRNASSNPLNALFPGAGAVIAGVKTGLATARAGIAVKQVTSQKFARGGKMGFFRGPSHAAGGVQGRFSDGTEVEVQGDEFWAVVNKNDAQSLRFLSDTNSRNGKRFFRDGGLMAPNTTPVPQSASAPNVGSSGDPALLAEMRAVRVAIQSFPRELRASVSYKQLRNADEKVRAIEASARN